MFVNIEKHVSRSLWQLNTDVNSSFNSPAAVTCSSHMNLEHFRTMKTMIAATQSQQLVVMGFDCLDLTFKFCLFVLGARRLSF